MLIFGVPIAIFDFSHHVVPLLGVNHLIVFKMNQTPFLQPFLNRLLFRSLSSRRFLTPLICWPPLVLLRLFICENKTKVDRPRFDPPTLGIVCRRINPLDPDAPPIWPNLIEIERHEKNKTGLMLSIF